MKKLLFVLLFLLPLIALSQTYKKISETKSVIRKDIDEDGQHYIDLLDLMGDIFFTRYYFMDDNPETLTHKNMLFFDKDYGPEIIKNLDESYVRLNDSTWINSMEGVIIEYVSKESVHHIIIEDL